jgi:hypothetical protein
MPGIGSPAATRSYAYLGTVLSSWVTSTRCHTAASRRSGWSFMPCRFLDKHIIQRWNAQPQPAQDTLVKIFVNEQA